MRFTTLVCACVLASAMLKAAELPVTNTIVSYPVWDHYTVPNGKVAFACVRSLGYGSVKEFQTRQHLFPNGIVGAETWASIEGLLGERRLAVRQETPLTVTVTGAQTRVSVVLSNRSAQAVCLLGNAAEEAEFEVVLHVRYSGRKSSGREYLSSKTIPLAFRTGTVILSHRSEMTHVSLSSLPAFDAARVWAECVIVHSSGISYLRSIATTIGRERL